MNNTDFRYLMHYGIWQNLKKELTRHFQSGFSTCCGNAIACLTNVYSAVRDL